MMHYAKLETSSRLKRALKVLQSRKKPFSTLELMQKAHIMAVNSTISELRQNGIAVKCKREGKLYFYSLENL